MQLYEDSDQTERGYRFVDPETDVITISRNAKFVELDNGTLSVEVPVWRSH